MRSQVKGMHNRKQHRQKKSHNGRRRSARNQAKARRPQRRRLSLLLTCWQVRTPSLEEFLCQTLVDWSPSVALTHILALQA